MYYADLHMHSTHSDGQLSVPEIIVHANERNLRAISITDHDTLDGTFEALSMKNTGKVEIIPGIEFSAVYKKNEFHILAYLFNTNNKDFINFVEELKNRRAERAKKIIEKFKQINIDIDLNDLLQEDKDDAIGRPHFARFLVEKGYANSFEEAFKKYLVPSAPCYVEKYAVSVEKVLEKVKKANGISILAHPVLVKEQKLIKEVISLGIDGIEVYHSKHSPKEEDKYLRIADRYNLLITGGSDNHSSNPEEYPFVGSVKIPYNYVDKLKEKVSSGGI